MHAFDLLIVRRNPPRGQRPRAARRGPATRVRSRTGNLFRKRTRMMARMWRVWAMAQQLPNTSINSERGEQWSRKLASCRGARNNARRTHEHHSHSSSSTLGRHRAVDRCVRACACSGDAGRRRAGDLPLAPCPSMSVRSGPGKPLRNHR